MSCPGGISVAFRGRIGAFALAAAFEAPGQGVTALFGPSGCGKTTVLRAIAGLQPLADGRCIVDGEVWQDGSRALPTHRRPIGFVFQDASLFPHLSVRRNLLYGAGGAVADDPLFGFEAVTRLLGLGALLGRSPRHLSGGERQRVAIGRALLSRPRLLLMDEPLSALDRRAKDEIIPFLERLHAALAIPTLYVTHDMAEVERLADHLVLMEQGRVVAAGPLAVLQSDPALPLLAGRDAAVTIEGTVTAFDPADGLASVAMPGATLLVPARGASPGERRRVSIAAGDVSLALDRPARSTILNVLPARVLSITATSAHEVTVVLALGEAGGGARLLSRVTRRSFAALELAEGQGIYAQIKGVALLRR